MQAEGAMNSVSINGEMIEISQVNFELISQQFVEEMTRAIVPVVKELEKAFIQFSVAVSIASAELIAALEASQEGEWWKRGGKPPIYKHSPNAPEWWQRGDEPPLFDTAA